MPRKRSRPRLSIYSVRDKIERKGPNVRIIEHIDPTLPVEDDVMVRAVLVDFDELAVLAPEACAQLVADLVDAVRFWRGGVKASKRGLSDRALAQQVLLSDIGRALERAGLPVTRWGKRYDRGDGLDADAPESFFFRFVRDLGDAFGIALPRDLKLPGKRAAHHQYGVMSPAMKAAQNDEMAAKAHRAGKPQRRRKSDAP